MGNRHKKLFSVVFRNSPFSIIVLFLMVFVVQAGSVQLNGCSTFMLKKGGHRIVGHNLDSGKNKPGLVIINKRGIKKKIRIVAGACVWESSPESSN